MSLGTRLQATAARLLEKHGKDVTIRSRSGTGVRDAAKPWRGSTGNSTVTVKAVQYPYEVDEMPDAMARRSHTRFIIAENNTAGDSQFAAVVMEEAIDVETLSGIWSVDEVEIIEPGDDRIVYLAMCKR